MKTIFQKAPTSSKELTSFLAAIQCIAKIPPQLPKLWGKANQMEQLFYGKTSQKN